MAREIKTVGDAISAYADAFREDDTGKKAAEILYDFVEMMESAKSLGRDQKIFCLAMEIDYILCGYLNMNKGGNE